MTSTPPALLDAVSTALVDAHAALAGPADDRVTRDALVALARASYDALQQWEAGTSATAETGSEATTWRTTIDDLRVQAALAEMELRDVDVPAVRAADHLARAVSSRLAAAGHEVGEALTSVRTELRKAVR